MNKYVALFLVTILNLENYRYNYGRKASQARIKTTSIKLPDKNGIPDFEFMEIFMKSLPYSQSIENFLSMINNHKNTMKTIFDGRNFIKTNKKYVLGIAKNQQY